MRWRLALPICLLVSFAVFGCASLSAKPPPRLTSATAASRSTPEITPRPILPPATLNTLTTPTPSEAGISLRRIATFPHEVNAYGLEWSPDSQRLVAGYGGDGTIAIWDIATGARTVLQEGEGLPVLDVAWSAYHAVGRSIIAAPINRSVTIWDGETLEELYSFNAVPFTYDLEFHPDGGLLAIGGARLLIWDIVAQQETVLPAMSSEVETLLARQRNKVEAVTWSPDGEQLAAVLTADCESYIIIFELDGGSPPHIIPVEGYAAESIDWSPDGEWLATTAGYCVPAPVAIWDAESGELAASTREEDLPDLYNMEIEFSTDSEFVAVGNMFGNSIYLINPLDGNLITTLSTGDNDVESLAWSPDGHMLAVSHISGIEVWEITRQ